jgi:hypothetical protein
LVGLFARQKFLETENHRPATPLVKVCAAVIDRSLVQKISKISNASSDEIKLILLFRAAFG